MKVSTLIPLLASSSVLGSSLVRSSRRGALSSRQAHVQRDLLDVCASLDLNLVVDDPLGGPPIIAGFLDVCLCISLIPDFIAVNAVAQVALDILGDEAALTAQLEALINGQDDKQQCTYPAHAQQLCSLDWPCGWQCGDGYEPYTPAGSPHPTQCTCPAPKSECNGKCGYFPHGCGSATPQRRHGRRSAPTCAPGRQVCGVPGGAKGRGYECVDTASDLESCGGCTVASPFTLSAPATGVDCSAIPEVASVECQSSACVVSACKNGFAPNAARDGCVAVLAVAERDLLSAGAIEGLGAVVAPIAVVAEGAAAGVKILRDAGILDAAVVEGLVADVAGVAVVGEGLGAGLHVGRDLVDAGLVEGLVADVKGLASVGEGLAAGAHVARDLLDAGLVEGLGAVVAPVVAVGEGAVANVKVLRDVPVLAAGLVEELGAVVTPVLAVGEGAVASVQILRRGVVDAGLLEGVGAVVDPLVPIAVVGEDAAAGVNVLRDVADAGLVEGLVAEVNGVATVGEGLVAGVRVGRDVPVVDAVVGAVAGAVVPDVVAVGAAAGAGVVVL